MENILTKDNFKCNRYCGKCCKKTIIRITQAEIKRIKNLGYEFEEFLERDMAFMDKFVLKITDNGCIFLKKHKDGKYSCTIYKNRPKTCKQYPFFKEYKAIKSCFPEKRYSNWDVSPHPKNGP